jgi:hypothetical protein
MAGWRQRYRERVDEAIYAAIPRSPDDPLGTDAVGARVEPVPVSGARVAEGIARLRERTNREDSIVSWQGRNGGYLITEEEDDIFDFQKSRMSLAMTVVRRTYYGAIRPFVTRFVAPHDPQQAREMLETFESALGKLEALVG